ncbi:MAG TPA: VOC family protein [Candidatus Limnocylindrales bacterium]|jgi:catechol 2,3-dioxygenase-like lactoylglutathione lyase family enzyme
MKLEISGFSHVAIRVTDLQRARRFYVELLGFPVALEIEGVVLVKAGSALVGIRADAAGAKPGDRFDPHRVGLDHVSFAVDSVGQLDRMKRDLDAAGVPNDGIHDEPDLNAKGLVFYDPDGIALELYAIQS